MARWTAWILVLGAAAGCPAADDTDDSGASQSAGSSTDATADGTSSDPSADGTASGGTTVTNDCGTFDTSEPGDSVIPQDPDDPEIVAACTSLCEAWAGIPDCTTDAEACLEACSMRSCTICPGTLAPLVECEAESFDAAACTCAADGPSCPTPDACADLSSATTQCGG